MRGSTSGRAILALLVSLGIVFVVRFWIIGYYVIPQDGMYPGLPARSRVFVWRRAYEAVSDIERGDVVAFQRIENGSRYLYVWRVVGLPGDRVVTSGRHVEIDGRTLHQDFVRKEGTASIFREANGTRSYDVAWSDSKTPADVPAASLTVPTGELFVMGDNRSNARDSRYFGAVPFATAIGRKI